MFRCPASRESTRNQLDIIAQLNDRPITDEIRLTIDARIEKAKSDPKAPERAQAVRYEIEREASGKRDAIAANVDATASRKAMVARSN